MAEPPALSLGVPLPVQPVPEESLPLASEIGALTARMVQGDEGAYRQFYDLYFNRLLRYLLVVANGQEETAREALQGTFLRAVRYMKRFESEPAFWSWLTVLARSAVFDEHRKTRRYRGLLERFFLREPPTALHNEIPDIDLVSRLDSTLQALSADERDIVDRKYFRKESVREIAATLGTTEKAIESRLVRARRRLKELILKGLEDETPR